MKNFDFDWQINEFMIYCRSTQLRERTMYSYEQTLRLFERWCADELKIYSVDKVTENVIRKYINDLQERGKYTFYVNDLSKEKNYPDRRRDYRKPVSVTTINNYIRNIRVFFNWLERDYVIRKNPMKKIRQLKYNRQAKVFLTDEDLRKLISKFDKSYFTEHRDYVMILLMLDSGMRLGECSTLLVTDLEITRRRINLRAEETKGRKDRTVYFSSKTEVGFHELVGQTLVEILLTGGVSGDRNHLKVGVVPAGFLKLPVLLGAELPSCGGELLSHLDSHLLFVDIHLISSWFMCFLLVFKRFLFSSFVTSLYHTTPRIGRYYMTRYL